MTIVLDFGTWHLESHNVTGLTIAFGASLATEVILDRPGAVIGITGNLGRRANTNELHLALTQGGGTLNIVIGGVLTSIRVNIFNSSAATNETSGSFYLLIWVRDSRNT